MEESIHLHLFLPRPSSPLPMSICGFLRSSTCKAAEIPKTGSPGRGQVNILESSWSTLWNICSQNVDLFAVNCFYSELVCVFVRKFSDRDSKTKNRNSSRRTRNQKPDPKGNKSTKENSRKEIEELEKQGPDLRYLRWANRREGDFLAWSHIVK